MNFRFIYIINFNFFFKGVGKSYVINSWKQLLNSNVNEPSAKITAPTGVAAYLVNGETLHSLLFLLDS